MGCANGKLYPPPDSEQFDAAFRTCAPGEPLTQALFQLCDLNHNGFISWNEYEAVCPPLGVTPNRELFQSVDTDRDGSLCFEEVPARGSDQTRATPRACRMLHSDAFVRLPDSQFDAMLKTGSLFGRALPTTAAPVVVMALPVA